MSELHARPPLLLFMKAVTKKQVWIPGYTKRNGQVVAGHMQWVNVSTEHDDHAVVSGNGTVSQKKAHEKMSKQKWFGEASHEHKLAHLLHESTKIADEKYITDQLSRIKSNAIKGKKILTGEWKTYQAVSAEKRKPIDDAIKAAGKWEEFSAAFEAWDKANPKAAEPAQAAAEPEPKAEPAPEPEKAPESVKEEPKNEPKKVVAAEPAPAPEPEAKPVEPADKPADTPKQPEGDGADAGLKPWRTHVPEGGGMPVAVSYKDLPKFEGEKDVKLQKKIDKIAKFAIAGDAQGLHDYYNKLLEPKAKAYAKEVVDFMAAKESEAGEPKGEKPKAEPKVDPSLKADADKALESGDMQTLKDIADYAAKNDMAPTAEYAAKHIGTLAAKIADSWAKPAHEPAEQPKTGAAALHPMPADGSMPTAPASIDANVAKVLQKWAKQGPLSHLENYAKPSGDSKMDTEEAYAAQLVDWVHAQSKAAETAAAAKSAMPEKPDTSGMSGIAHDAVDAIHSLLTTGSAVGHIGGQVSNLQDYYAAFDYPQNSLDDKKVAAYAKAALESLGEEAKHKGAPAADAGPKEGDTKMGADGMLVFKDGRWHKQGGDEPKATDPKELAKKVASVTKPKFEGKNSVKMNKTVKALQAIALKDGAAGLDKVIGLSKPNGYKVTIDAGDGAKWGIFKDPSYGASTANGIKLKDYALALQAAMEGTTGAGDAAVAATPKAKKAAPKATGSTVTTTESVDGWKQIGPQGGYNPGGTFEDKSGQKWYVKFPAGGEKIAKNELLATKLYALAGVDVPEVKLINQGGKIGLASKIVDGAVANKSALLEGKAKGLLQGFAADAWLANWDAVGNNPAAGKGFDNILIKPDGSAVRIDAGGALLYGGAGGKKQKFEEDVVELKTMLDSSINPNTAAVFGKMSAADIAASVAKVAAISDDHIESLVQTYGPGSQAEKDRLAAKLIARKENMVAQYPSVAKSAAPKTLKPKSGKTIDPNDTSWVSLKKGQKIVEAGVSQWGVQFAKIENPAAGFNAEKLPQPKPYTASKSEHVNAANTADMQKLFNNAVEGKTAAAVEGTLFEQISKETGEKTGKMLTIEQHPSKVYLQEYATQLAAEVKAQTSPTYEMQTRGSATGSYSDIASRIASKVKTIAYEQFKTWKNKAADYMVLNKSEADGIPKPEPGMFHDMEKGTKEFNDFKKASDKNYDKLTADEKTACKAYTGSAYVKWNEALRMGQVDSTHFSGSADMRAAFAKAAVELPEGIILHRGIGVGGDTYKSVVGAVIQDGSFQSTSFGNSAAFSGKESQLRLHVTKGVKAMMAATFSSHSEREIILHPNTRYVVMGVEYKNGQNHVDILVLPHEE
jgi:hypothetical protein